VIWFRIVDDMPADRKLAPRAPTITDGSLIVVQTVNVTSITRATKEVCISAEDKDGTTQLSFQLFSPASLTVDDLQTLRMWRESDALAISLGLPNPMFECHPAFQQVCEGLLLTCGPAGSSRPFTLAPGSADFDLKKEVLAVLREHGRARQLHTGSHSWMMTESGQASVRTSVRLSSPVRLLDAKPDAQIKDMSVFELLLRLDSLGWSCVVWQKVWQKALAANVRHKSDTTKSSAPRFQDYMHGKRRVWWLKPKSRTVHPYYLRCLLDAERLACPIPHFKTETWYECLFLGKPYEERRRKGTFKFQRAGEASFGSRGQATDWVELFPIGSRFVYPGDSRFGGKLAARAWLDLGLRLKDFQEGRSHCAGRHGWCSQTGRPPGFSQSTSDPGFSRGGRRAFHEGRETS